MTEFKSFPEEATVDSPDGEWACRLDPDAFLPEERPTGKATELPSGNMYQEIKYVVPAKKLEAAQLACAQCVRFEECFNEDLKGMRYGVVAGVNTGAGSAKKARQAARMLELRSEYLTQIDRDIAS